MQRVFGMLVHSDPTGPIRHFRDAGRIYLVIGQCREALQAVALWFRKLAVLELLYGPGHHSGGFLIRPLHKTSVQRVSRFPPIPPSSHARDYVAGEVEVTAAGYASFIG